MFTRRAALISAAATALVLATPAFAAGELKLPRQKVELVAPPFVHAHEQATTQAPKIMEFKLTIEEKKVVIDDKGTTFQAMTFNGSMPGPLMVVHEGDYVELTLVNPATSSMPHNIDSTPRPVRSVVPSSRWSIRASRSCCAGRRRGPACSSITARRAAR